MEVYVPEEVIKEIPADLTARILLLETKILFLEAKLSELGKQSIKTFLKFTEPQIGIYGANRKPRDNSRD